VAAEVYPLEKLLDPIIPCKTKLLENGNGSFTITSVCGGG